MCWYISTYLDEIVDYSYKACLDLAQSKKIVGLLYDDPNVDMAIEQPLNSRIFDFDYVDGLVQEDYSFICVDTIIPRFTSHSIKEVYLTVLVIVHKNTIKLDSRKFVGIKGNRRDNLVREIDLVLRNSDRFGIGNLKLLNVKPVSLPQNLYSCKLLTYECPNFANGNIKND